MATSSSPRASRRKSFPAQAKPLVRKPAERTRFDFEAKTSKVRIARIARAKEREGSYGINLQPLYLGIAAMQIENGQVEVGFASHDGTYSIDFASYVVGGVVAPDYLAAGLKALELPTRTQSPSGFDIKGRENQPTTHGNYSGPPTPLNPDEISSRLTEYFIQKIQDYEGAHFYKFMGCGITQGLAKLCPHLPSRLWADLDIVPMVFENGLNTPLSNRRGPRSLSVDEEADSMARKCLMYYGPIQQPRVQVGFRNQVEVDCGGHVQLTHLDQYRATVGELTWNATLRYASSLNNRKIKIAFFNSTPQGGGVALMRHALIRFFHALNVEASWFVPKPRPEVFRITKNNHNILQGVADPKERLTPEKQSILDEWVHQNADRFWTRDDGPLAPRENGGADVIIVDDPQMPNIITISKKIDPKRPVIFRSHIQVRSDLIDKKGSPTEEVWQWIWKSVKEADLFISHPVREFVPSTVDRKLVGYLPATTDWLDGLNKDLSEWDLEYYIHEFNSECHKQRLPALDFPARQYIAQIARFDPSKGIPDVLAAYAELRRNYMKDLPQKETPQLVLAGHGAVDDPDGTFILDQTLGLLETKYKDLQSDVVVMRLGPTDQVLNALMSNAKVVLQLSTREGFEVKVSEALHKGIPIIATRAGGIPLQVIDGKSGFLVEPGDSSAVAQHLYTLFTDADTYENMSEHAATHVSDEVGTVGNALAWLYLADTLSKGEKLEPNGRWINDLARETIGLGYVEGETRLPRVKTLDL